ncbi:heavy-metal-associated domain-containing protein [Glycomyces sp. NPDC021274]|uniref:heavy-metal-associated domain-containing protein n=1 Tax=Glycomyces sp. NPDC021274 TaxID=3155120 RepID=UPI00340DF3CD
MIVVDYSLVAFRLTSLSAGTCAHCVARLQSRLRGVVGVMNVDVTPDSGQVHVLVDALHVAESVADELWEAGWEREPECAGSPSMMA